MVIRVIGVEARLDSTLERPGVDLVDGVGVLVTAAADRKERLAVGADLPVARPIPEADETDRRVVVGFEFRDDLVGVDAVAKARGLVRREVHLLAERLVSPPPRRFLPFVFALVHALYRRHESRTDQAPVRHEVPNRSTLIAGCRTGLLPGDTIGVTANAEGRERYQRLAIGLAAAANKGRVILMGTAMSVYIGQVGTPFAVSLVFTVYWFGLMVFSPVAGAIADVTGRRRGVLVGTALCSTLAILPLTVVDGVWGPLAFRGLFAVFAAGFLPVMLAIVSERGGDAARGQSLGFFNSTQAVGFTLAQFFAGVLLGLVAPWALYLVVAAVSAVVVLAAVFVADPTPPTTTDRPTLAELGREVKHRLLPAPEDRAHLESHGLKWLYVAVLLRNMTVLGTSSLLPIYLLGEIGVSAFVMGILLAINPAAQMLFMYLFGYVADAAGRKPLVVYGMAAAGVHALIVTAAVVPASLFVRAAVVALAFLLLAAAYSSETTGTYAFIGDIAPEARESELMGLHSTARGFGGVIGPPLIGGLATLFSYEVAFASGSLLAFTATALVARFLVESYRTPVSPPGASPED